VEEGELRPGGQRGLRLFFIAAGCGHLIFGIAGTAFPRWFFTAAPPWPPLHVGQIQIAGVFDLALATGFLVAASDVEAYANLMLAVGLVADWGHAAVRLAHMVLGDNPRADWPGPVAMLLIGAVCLIAGLPRWAPRSRPRPALR
jgi:hypothetical protein